MLSSCTLIHRIKKEVNHLHKHQHLEKELYKELCQLPQTEGLSASFILYYLQFQFGLELEMNLEQKGKENVFVIFVLHTRN